MINEAAIKNVAYSKGKINKSSFNNLEVYDRVAYFLHSPLKQAKSIKYTTHTENPKHLV